MLRLKDQYDWIVLGDSPGALLTGVLVSKIGLSVLILPLSSGAGLEITDEGQYLDREPNFLIGLGKLDSAKGLVSECLAQAGILPSELNRISRDDVMPQVLTPGLRLYCSPEDEQLQWELERELGAKIAKDIGLAAALAKAETPILNFWRRLPERLTLVPNKKRVPKPRTVEQLQKQLLQSNRAGKGAELAWFRSGLRLAQFSEKKAAKELRELGLALAYAASGVEQNDPNLFEMLHWITLLRTGASFSGGLSAYREFLMKMAKRLGAHVPEKSECRRIFVENGRFVGAQVADRANVVGARGAVLGCSLDHAAKLASVSGRRLLHRLKRAPRPQGWVYTLALSVRSEALPPGMHRRLFWQESGAPMLSVEVADPNAYGSTQPGISWLFVRTVLPFDNASLDPAHLRRISARMLRQVTEFIPFLEYHLVRIYPDFRSSGLEIQAAYPYKSVDEVPEGLRSISGRGMGSHSGVEGLFLATSEAYPKWGSFGPSVAALEATAWIAHRCGLPGPFG